MTDELPVEEDVRARIYVPMAEGYRVWVDPAPEGAFRVSVTGPFEGCRVLHVMGKTNCAAATEGIMWVLERMKKTKKVIDNSRAGVQ